MYFSDVLVYELTVTTRYVADKTVEYYEETRFYRTAVQADACAPSLGLLDYDEGSYWEDSDGRLQVDPGWCYEVVDVQVNKLK